MIESNDEDVAGALDLAFSMGVTVDSGGVVRDVIHGGPAYAAGIGPGMKIVAVNSLQFSADGLRSAIDAAKTATEPIRLIVSNGAQFQDFSVDYHGGLKYPHIERNEAHPDYLSEILRPLAK